MDKLLFKAAHKNEIDAIYYCYTQKHAVLKQVDCGIIQMADAAEEIDMIKKRERNLKKKLVLEAHVKEDGTPRTIKYQESKGLWCALMPGKKRITAKSEDALIDKLMEYYGLTITDYSIGAVFEIAMNEKEGSGVNAFETLRRIRQDYKRYINDSFAGTDIRTVSNGVLRKYTADMLKANEITVGAFRNYRIMMNTIFKYAVREGIIDRNPVDCVTVREYSPLCKVPQAKASVSKEEEQILSPEEIGTLKEKIEWRIRRFGYYPHGYAMLLAIETGMRAGELPALKWSDIGEDTIHIHSQQLYTRESGKKEFYYVPWTKDEKKKLKKTGRFFPLTDAIKDILSRIRQDQERLGISSEYIFVNEDGEPIHSDNYERNILKLFTSLGFTVHHNHALRKSLNSNVLIPLGIPATDRARMLGHSVETNLRYYSFAGKNRNNDICAMLNSLSAGNSRTEWQVSDHGTAKNSLVTPWSHPGAVFQA